MAAEIDPAGAQVVAPLATAYIPAAQGCTEIGCRGRRSRSRFNTRRSCGYMSRAWGACAEFKRENVAVRVHGVGGHVIGLHRGYTCRERGVHVQSLNVKM